MLAKELKPIVAIEFIPFLFERVWLGKVCIALLPLKWFLELFQAGKRGGRKRKKG
jgi:hypothetical protein